MDGIDAALIDFASGKPELLASHSEPLTSTIQSQLRAFSSGENQSIDAFGQLDVTLGKAFAQAARELLEKARCSAHDVQAIGSHGQTLIHRPNLKPAFTLQIADPNYIAQITGITTVADFRRRDMAAGGEGAPLAPGFHKYFFQTPAETRVILNIGGIANITLLPMDAAAKISGFDTGPGNTLLDAWSRKHLQQPRDNDGEWAAQGSILPELLNRLLDDPYLKLPAPKSTGPEYFNLNWLDAHLLSTYQPTDVQATLTAYTARSIAEAITMHAAEAKHIYICGGGVHNKTLMKQLALELPNCCIESTERVGLHPDWIEAVAFAWLAKQTLGFQAGNLPEVTGASTPVILGGIYPGQIA